MKFPFRARGICLFLLPFAFLSAASGQDSPIVRGPFGKPVGVYDEGGNLTIPITVYEDSRVEILISDITGEGWMQWHIDQYRAEGKYWVILYSFFKGKGHCLKTVGGSAQSGCVDYARYEKQIIVVDTKLHTVKFTEIAAYYGERTQSVGFEREPSGSYAIISLDPALAKAINRISAIVENQLNSYTGLGAWKIGEEQSKIVARMVTNSMHPDTTNSSTKSTNASGTTNDGIYGLAARNAAEQGNANAQFSLGNAYRIGQGVPQDYTQAALWYRKAAEQGNANAQINLGTSYALGQGVPQDYTQSALWYRKAAEQGNANAQFSLGASYDLGQGLPQDFAQAAIWYRKAAEQGNADAQINLGAMYDYGQGVPQDYAEALFWLDVAASRKLGSIKEEDAYKLLKDDAASHLTSAVLLQIQERARKWVEDHPVKP
ncbi:MAG: tetratricopeptide repeat protein [Terracidiphilus sp.]|jgi:hypothetical protein